MFMEDLPHRLRLNLAMVIHQKMHSSVKFFQKKEKSFIAWMSTIMKPIVYDEGKYIYEDGDEITESKLYLKLNFI